MCANTELDSKSLWPNSLNFCKYWLWLVCASNTFWPIWLVCVHMSQTVTIGLRLIKCVIRWAMWQLICCCRTSSMERAPCWFEKHWFAFLVLPKTYDLLVCLHIQLLTVFLQIILYYVCNSISSLTIFYLVFIIVRRRWALVKRRDRKSWWWWWWWWKISD